MLAFFNLLFTVFGPNHLICSNICFGSCSSTVVSLWFSTVVYIDQTLLF